MSSSGLNCAHAANIAAKVCRAQVVTVMLHMPRCRPVKTPSYPGKQCKLCICALSSSSSAWCSLHAHSLSDLSQSCTSSLLISVCLGALCADRQSLC